MTRNKRRTRPMIISVVLRYLLSWNISIDSGLKLTDNSNEFFWTHLYIRIPQDWKLEKETMFFAPVSNLEVYEWINEFKKTFRCERDNFYILLKQMRIHLTVYLWMFIICLFIVIKRSYNKALLITGPSCSCVNYRLIFLLLSISIFLKKYCTEKYPIFFQKIKFCTKNKSVFKTIYQHLISWIN